MSERSEQRRSEEEWRDGAAAPPPSPSRLKPLVIGICVIALLALGWWLWHAA